MERWMDGWFLLTSASTNLEFVCLFNIYYTLLRRTEIGKGVIKMKRNEKHLIALTNPSALGFILTRIETTFRSCNSGINVEHLIKIFGIILRTLSSKEKTNIIESLFLVFHYCNFIKFLYLWCLCHETVSFAYQLSFSRQKKLNSFFFLNMMFVFAICPSNEKRNCSSSIFFTHRLLLSH